ncbi:MAG: apolipoprotein N-acyltransferase [Hyphomicrobiaceae bacterium]
MPSLAKSILGLTGWRRWAVLALAGAASVLAMAPFFAWPVLFVTLPVLVWQIDACQQAVVSGESRVGWRHHPAMRAAFAGWWFGFGYFFAGLFWIGEAFLVEAEKFAVLIPLAVTLMPAGLALFWAGAAGVAALAWAPGWTRIVALALTMAAAEWLRGHVLTGFPWNVLGYALTWPLPMMQTAALLGIYGLTLVALPVFAAPAVLWADGGRWRGRGVLVAATAIGVLAAAGAYRLANEDPPADGSVRIRVVQPSVPQREKWRPENQGRIFRDHLELSAQSSSGAVDGASGLALIVWPEAAMPFLPLNTPDALAAIGRLLPQGTHLAAGALRADAPPSGRTRRRIFNSLMIFGQEGRLVGLYDKIHLVPFGEYLPLQSTLEAIGLEQLTRIRGGFDIGATPRPVLQVAGLPSIGPLICYEAIFPAAVIQGGERPRLLLNVTNDGWFGQTTGPHQHLHQARVRAVEEGLPIIRSANNGISAVIDARGRIIGSLGLDVRGTIDNTLPPAIAPPLYARYGDWIFLVLFGAAGCIWLAMQTRVKDPN